MTNSRNGNAIFDNSNSLTVPAPRGTGSPAPSGRPDINIARSFKRHWRISLSVFLVLLAAGGFVLWKKAKPLYKAQSVVYVSPRFPKILANDNELELPYDSYFADQIQRSTRRDILEEALAKLPDAVRHWSGPVLPYEIEFLQKRLEVERIGST